MIVGVNSLRTIFYDNYICMMRKLTFLFATGDTLLCGSKFGTAKDINIYIVPRKHLSKIFLKFCNCIDIVSKKSISNSMQVYIYDRFNSIVHTTFGPIE